MPGQFSFLIRQLIIAGLISGLGLFYQITMSMLLVHQVGLHCSQEDMHGKWEFKEETLKNISPQVKSFKSVKF